MAKQAKPVTRKGVPNTGNEEVPPGATRKAADRATDPGGGPPGSGAGDRHASGEAGGGNTSTGLVGNEGAYPADEDQEDQGPYAGNAGGAVGGTPAGRRSSGGTTHGGIAPGGVHRGDSTIGSPPSGTRKRGKSQK